jgi:hypothetical protein
VTCARWNLIRRRDPRCHLTQIHLMTKTETSRSQGPCSSMVDSMGNHLPDLCRETSELIRNVYPRRQHHCNSGDHHVMKRRVMLTAKLRQGCGGTRPSSRTVPLMGSIRQLLGQIFAGPPQLFHLGLCDSQLLPSTWGEKKERLRTVPIQIG